MELGVKHKAILLGRCFLSTFIHGCILFPVVTHPNYHIFRDQESHNHYRKYQDYSEEGSCFQEELNTAVATEKLELAHVSPSLGSPLILALNLIMTISSSQHLTIHPFQHRQDSPMSASFLLSIQIKTRSVLCYHTFRADVP